MRLLARKLLVMSEACVLLAICSSAGNNVLAQEEPVPPCEGSPAPAAGVSGQSLNQLVWTEDDLAAGWSPPMCTGWHSGPTKVLLAAAGRFTMAGDTAALADRLTSISTLTDIVYWSTSRGRWRSLFKEAVALSEPDRKAQRPDFAIADFVSGAELHYWLEEDNPTAGVIYRMIVHERTPDRLVFESINLTPLRAKLLFIRPEIAAAGEYRQLYFIERETGNTWRYYSLVRMGKASSLGGTSVANYQNRAEAYFRYLAGLRMDREPPAAP